MAEVPYGVLLSGGLDSSLIASIAARETEKIAAGYRGSDSDVENFDESKLKKKPDSDLLLTIHQVVLVYGLDSTHSLLVSRDLPT
jgi:asparagine synthetase B (glutamine-hydrolysing)